MNTERWAAIKTVFHDALSYPVDQRSEFLASACRDDSDLFTEVTSMLAHHDLAGAFLESPDVPISPLPELRVGKHLGHYRIVRFISEGGMGEVYEAIRDDGEYSKRVAIKLVKGGWGIHDLLKRFQHERQALANLEHPNIARLLDGGTTEDGLPYLVMEYVQGVPIDEYCDQQGLSIDERLKLFRTVCSAVHYAHQNLIVHRDLKPGNILVNDAGVPTLLDFGIAKILNADVVPTDDVTRTGVRFITLEYASPEQIRSESITTASDIYSLGVLLFNLLTGQRPYRFNSNLPHEVSRIVCEEQPQRPSAAIQQTHPSSAARDASAVRNTSPEKLRRLLSGDLDNIVLKALQKDPQRRYDSVEQFSGDVRRHLEGQPVIAARDSFGYRASKFISRNRIAAAAASAFILLLLASVVLVSWQANVAMRQRDRARTEAAKAEKVITFLQEMLSAANPYISGKQPSISDVLEKAAQRLETELTGQSEVEATARHTIGVAYIGLGLFDKAETQLTKALAISRGVSGEGSIDVAAGIQSLALLRAYQGYYFSSDSLFQKSILLYRSNPDTKRASLSETLNNYGTLLLETGDYDRAIVVFEEALGLSREEYGQDHTEIATLLNNIGIAYHNKVDRGQAEHYYRESLAMRLKVLGPEHPNVASSYNNIAYILMEKEKFDDAEEMFRTSLALRRRLLGDVHPDVAALLNNLALCAWRAHKLDSAEMYARKAIGLWHSTVGAHHPDIARGLNLLGAILGGKGRFSEAEKQLREAMRIRYASLPAQHYLTSVTEGELGNTLLQQGRVNEAEPLLQKSYNNLAKVLGEKADETQRVKKFITNGRLVVQSLPDK